jgi:hypothetical protein
MLHGQLLLLIPVLCKSGCHTDRPRSRIPQQECHSVEECDLNTDPRNTGKMLPAWAMRYEVQVQVGTQVTNLVHGKIHWTVLHLSRLDV